MLSVKRTNQTIIATIMAGIVTIAIFNLYPSLDIEIARYFFTGNGRFLFQDIEIIAQLRSLTMASYIIWYVLIIIALIVALSKKTTIIGFAARDWFYLMMCSLIGPGILANEILKTYSGRARPRDIQEFGSSLDFTPVANWSTECATNCSFVSGEVSSMVMLFAPFIFICAKRRWFWIAATFIFGSLASLMRIGQGGHFTSDCLMAGVLMVFTAAILYKIIYQRTATQE